MQQLIFLSLNTETPVIMIPQKKKWGGGKTPIFFVVGNFKVIGFCWLHNKKKTSHLLSSAWVSTALSTRSWLKVDVSGLLS